MTTYFKIICFFVCLLTFNKPINSQCIENEKILKILITPDSYPYETSWRVQNAEGEVLLSANSAISDSVCVKPDNCYIFTIYDQFGDGICCTSGLGAYYIVLNTDTLTVGGEFSTAESKTINCNEGGYCTNALPIVEGNFSTPANTWYIFVPTQSGIYEINTCESPCNTTIFIYDNCNGLTWNDSPMGTIFYNENSSDCDTLAHSTVAFEANHTYYIKIGDFETACNNQLINWTLNFYAPISGCTDPAACNFNPLATISDSCYYQGSPNCQNIGPDLTVVQSDILNSLYINQTNADNCSINEGCYTGTGNRWLLHFTTHIKNIGNQDYYIGSPQQNPEQFVFDACHGHYHYSGYAEYLLYDNTGNMLPIGFKNGFCVMDLECNNWGNAKYTCDNMGISANCGDIYDSTLPCQWIDVTNVPAGIYSLVIRVNWDKSPDALGRFELDYNNNFTYICFQLLWNNNTPSFTLQNNCPVITDCANVPFGNSILDCNGICNGGTIIGDVNNDHTQTVFDAYNYVQAAVNNSISPNPCTDLCSDGFINILDAANMVNCDLNKVCNFPYYLSNYNDSAQLKIIDYNLQLGFVDIGITNSVGILGYQFKMSGLQILSVQSLANPIQYPVIPEYVTGGQSVIALSYQGLYLPINLQASPLCRIYFQTVSDTIICIDKIIAVVNNKFEYIPSIIDGSCISTEVTAISPAPINAQIQILPNPCTNGNCVLHLKLNSEENPTKLLIFNILGKQILNQNILLHTGWQTINLQQLNAGIYFIKLVNKQGNQTHKLVIE